MRLLFASSAAPEESYRDKALRPSKLARVTVTAPLKELSASSAATDHGWTISAVPAAQAPAADNCRPVQPASRRLSLTLDLELTAEEVLCIVQPPVGPNAWQLMQRCRSPMVEAVGTAVLPLPANRVAPASKPAVRPSLVRRASASLRRIRSRLASATCLARPFKVAQ